MNGLANLTKLKDLRLYNTQVSGSINGLANMTQLTYLDLQSTSISGSMDGLANLTNMQTLYPHCVACALPCAAVQTT